MEVKNKTKKIMHYQKQLRAGLIDHYTEKQNATKVNAHATNTRTNKSD